MESVVSHDKSLAERIVAATRPHHARLNKKIVSRIPQALPPRAEDPSLYVTGILHIAPIYMTFESLLKDILDFPPVGKCPIQCNGHLLTINPDSISQPGVSTANHAPGCNRIHSILKNVHLPGLLRSAVLLEDIKAMTGWPEDVIMEQITTISQTGGIAEFVNHMKSFVGEKPHRLIAYSYIFYMALFAGGRFTRATLQSAGRDFWNRVPSPVRPMMLACEKNNDLVADGTESEEMEEDRGAQGLPLRLFFFSTPTNGEDLKIGYKQILSDSEELMTAEEQEDIVQEAEWIFTSMAFVIDQLDAVCNDYSRESPDNNDLLRRISLPTGALMSRLRDSLVVAKDRWTAKASQQDRSRRTSKSEDVQISTNSASEFHSGAHHGASGSEVCPGFSSKTVHFKHMQPMHASKLEQSYDGTVDLDRRFTRNPNSITTRLLFRLPMALGFVLMMLVALYFLPSGSMILQETARV